MPEETAREKTIYATLEKMYPDAQCELNYTTPLELLVATVLSAQCTDVRVNQVTESLFRKYRLPRDYTRAPAEELEEDIRSTGFFRQKTKSLRAIMRTLIDQYDGEVPGTLEALTALPGIGRKTANVILGNAFDIPGITVDTHVKRVSNRLGLTDNVNPDKIEQDLMKRFPEEQWTQLSHLLIFHGRYTCKARKPQCEECRLQQECRDYAENAAS